MKVIGGGTPTCRRIRARVTHRIGQRVIVCRFTQRKLYNSGIAKKCRQPDATWMGE